MNVSGSRLPFLLPWLRVNLLIRSIAERAWDERVWPIAKADLGRAFEIRRDLARRPCFKTRDFIDIQSFIWVQGADEYDG